MRKSDPPLPQSPRQWAALGISIAILILIFTTSAAVAMHVADDQFIGNDELKRDLTTLQSYASEASLIAENSQIPRAPRTYAESYSDSLKEASDSVSEKLTDHGHRPDLDQKVQETIKLADQLSNQLETISIDPTSQWPKNFDQQFKDLSTQFQNLQAGL